MVENSKEKLYFTEFRLMSRTKKDYNRRRILTISEKVVSFLDLLLIHLPMSKKKNCVFSKKRIQIKALQRCESLFCSIIIALLTHLAPHVSRKCRLLRNTRKILKICDLSRNHYKTRLFSVRKTCKKREIATITRKSGIQKNTCNLHKYAQSRKSTIKHEQIEPPRSNTTNNTQITLKKRYSVQTRKTRRNIF